jgi:hypothetical protein
LYCQPIGRRDPGRPGKRCLDVWGWNELRSSTLADDDDDEEDDDDDADDDDDDENRFSLLRSLM